MNMKKKYMKPNVISYGIHCEGAILGDSEWETNCADSKQNTDFDWNDWDDDSDPQTTSKDDKVSLWD